MDVVEDKPQFSDLDEFGKHLMAEVRDLSVHSAFKLLEGKMKGPRQIFANQILAEIPVHDTDVLKSFMVLAIDDAIANFLGMLEDCKGEEDGYDLIKHTTNGDLISLRELSDGLAGEPFEDGGWIDRFSKYPEWKGVTTQI